jgi:hypothetical protein
MSVDLAQNGGDSSGRRSVRTAIATGSGRPGAMIVFAFCCVRPTLILRAKSAPYDHVKAVRVPNHLGNQTCAVATSMTWHFLIDSSGAVMKSEPGPM